MKHTLRTSVLLTTGLLVASAVPASADEASEIAEIRAEMHTLELKLEALEARRGQTPAPYPANAPTTAPKTAASESESSRINIDTTGFSFASADASDFIRLHGLVQLDSRWYLDDKSISNNDGFLIRRARLIFEGGFDGIYSFNLVPEFGGGATGSSNAPVIYDANLGVSLGSALKFTVGKFKSPIGQEMLQNDAALLFAERSLATNLVPSRDVGVQAGGDLASGVINYTLAVLDGNADAAYTTNVPLDNNKDFVARLILRPFKNDSQSPLQGLGFGIAASRGSHNTSAGLTSGYKSDGQQAIFSYNTGVVPYGAIWRLAPQANFYRGSLGLQAEYTRSAVTVLSGKTQQELQNDAWQVSGGYFLTGEKASYDGIRPHSPFNPASGDWGAWEIAARIANLKIDPSAFPLFANPSASVSGVDSRQIGLNWYLSKTVRAMFDYGVDRFNHPLTVASFTNTAIAQDEKAFITRFQVGF